MISAVERRASPSSVSCLYLHLFSVASGALFLLTDSLFRLHRHDTPAGTTESFFYYWFFESKRCCVCPSVTSTTRGKGCVDTCRKREDDIMWGYIQHLTAPFLSKQRIKSSLQNKTKNPIQQVCWTLYLSSTTCLTNTNQPHPTLPICCSSLPFFPCSLSCLLPLSPNATPVPRSSQAETANACPLAATTTATVFQSSLLTVIKPKLGISTLGPAVLFFTELTSLWTLVLAVTTTRVSRFVPVVPLKPQASLTSCVQIWTSYPGLFQQT